MIYEWTGILQSLLNELVLLVLTEILRKIMRAQYKIKFDRPLRLKKRPEALIISPEIRNQDRHKIEISTIHRSRERLGRVDSGETIVLLRVIFVLHFICGFFLNINVNVYLFLFVF
jgi:hypothetical protein